MSQLPYLAGANIEGSRFPREVELEFAPSEGKPFRNLVLTGRNGAGKSSILLGIHNELAQLLGGRPQTPGEQAKLLRKNIDQHEQILRHAGPQSDQREKSRTTILQTEKRLEALLEAPIASLKYTGNVEAFFKGMLEKQYLYCYLPAKRTAQVEPVQGPNKTSLEGAPKRQSESLSRFFLQFLVNKRTSQAYAREDGDSEEANSIGRWFDSLRDIFREVFSDELLEFKFKRDTFNFNFHLSDGRTLDFNQLSDGYSSTLSILSEIFIRLDYLKALHPEFDGAGIVLIDEVETHLHLQLQRSLMPLLQKLFPKIQFIVATHSPTVIASMENSTIYDLSSGKKEESSLGAIPLNVLAKEHFGLSSEFSMNVASKLEKAKELLKKVGRTETEKLELSLLASELERMSAAVAEEIQLEIFRQEKNQNK